MVKAPLTVKADAVLFSVIAVTLEPTAELMTLAAVPVPILVIVPALFTAAVDKVIARLFVTFNSRLPVPVTPPVIVSVPPAVCSIKSWLLSVTGPLKILAAESVIVARPVLPAATEIVFANVPMSPPLNVA